MQQVTNLTLAPPHKLMEDMSEDDIFNWLVEWEARCTKIKADIAKAKEDLDYAEKKRSIVIKYLAYKKVNRS